MENNHKPKLVKEIIIGIAAIVLILIVLLVGMNIGERRARFAGEFGNNFERNFLGERGGMRGMMFGAMFPGGHGAIGKIVSINLPQIIIAGPDNLERTVLIETDTIIRSFQTNIQSTDLKVGNFVVVIGSPNNNGQIVASLVRLMPNPAGPTTATTTNNP